MAFLDALLELTEARKVRAASLLENTENTSKLRLLKLDVEDVQVGSTACPVLDLIQWASTFSGILRVLSGCDLLDLSSPVDHSRLESL